MKRKNIQLVLKLGLSIYVMMVLVLSALSKANTNFTNDFLKPVESQLHIEISGVFEEDQGALYFVADEGTVYHVTPQCYSNFSAKELVLPQKARISGFLVKNFPTSELNSVQPGSLYIFSIVKF